MTLTLVFVAALLLAYANGANGNFKAAATVYGAGALGYRTSLWLATAAQLCGSLAALFVATKLVRAFSGHGLVPDHTVADPTFLLAVGVGASLTILLATRLGFPVSTTHALIGGLTGAGLALAPGQFDAVLLGSRYFLPLLISPLIALAASALIYPMAKNAKRAAGVEAGSCVCVGESVRAPGAAPAGIGGGAVAFATTRLEVTVAHEEHCRARGKDSVLGLPVNETLDALHGVSAFALGFARGLHDIPKVLALLITVQWAGLGPTASVLVIAVVMAAGGLMHSRNVAETLGKGITELSRGQGLAANLVASGLVISASLLGSPVSTTHVATGAIYGVGLASGQGAASRRMSGIVMAWLLTLPIGAAIAFALARLWGTG